MGIQQTNNNTGPVYPTGDDMSNFIGICNFLRELAQPVGNNTSGNGRTSSGPARSKISIAVLQNGIPIPGRRPKKLHPARNLQQLLEEAIRNLLFLYTGTQVNSEKAEKATHPHMQTVLLIYQEIRECPNIRTHTLAYFADKYALSTSTLKRSFKNILQMTIHKFITNECMRKAIRLREESGLTLGEIAEVLGYSDKSGFVRTLRRFERQSR